MSISRLALGVLGILGSSFLIVTAGELTGTIVVTSKATGPNVAIAVIYIDFDSGTTGGPIAMDGGTFTTPNAPAGDHTLRVEQLPANCTVDGGTERRITVVPRQTTKIALSISCQ